MATKFKREDAMTCFRCHSDSPTFRLISLVKLPTENRTLEPDCLVELLCTPCLRFEIDDLYEGFAQLSVPVGADESPDACLSRQIGFAVVPLTFSERACQLLVDELRTDGLELTVN
jgi:hypothetical protein